jgi:hypothetical protein
VGTFTIRATTRAAKTLPFFKGVSAGLALEGLYEEPFPLRGNGF